MKKRRRILRSVRRIVMSSLLPISDSRHIFDLFTDTKKNFGLNVNRMHLNKVIYEILTCFKYSFMSLYSHLLIHIQLFLFHSTCHFSDRINLFYWEKDSLKKYPHKEKQNEAHNVKFPLFCAVAYRGGFGVFNPPPPPEIPKFYKVERDCKLSGKSLMFLFQHPN
jgi:hypothetical protein